MTPERLSARLKETNDRFAKAFPYMANAASLKFVLDPHVKGAGNFVATVPSYSTLYTDCFGFWEVLGYPPKYYDTFPATFANADIAVRRLRL